MKCIVITMVPPGQAPFWVRKKWVGLKLSVLGLTDRQKTQRGVLGGAPSNNHGYRVSAIDAINRLKVVAPDAAEWWENHLPLLNGSELVFAKSTCQLA